jgi:hypothetical protein
VQSDDHSVALRLDGLGLVVAGESHLTELGDPMVCDAEQHAAIAHTNNDEGTALAE